jgi:hypothetical protein
MVRDAVLWDSKVLVDDDDDGVVVVSTLMPRPRSLQ